MIEDGTVTEEQQNPGRPWGRIVIWLALFAFLILLGVGLSRTQQGPIGVGAKAPDFEITTFEDEVIRVKDLRGKVVVINFWASWCTPCAQEAEELEQAYQLYKDQGVAFIGVDYVDTPTEAHGYLATHAITYPNGPDLGTSISQAFRIRGVPETYILAADGTIVRVKIGPYMSLDAVVADIEYALRQ